MLNIKFKFKVGDCIQCASFNFVPLKYHAMFGIGAPIASQVKLTVFPSVTFLSCTSVTISVDITHTVK